MMITPRILRIVATMPRIFSHAGIRSINSQPMMHCTAALISEDTVII